MRRYGIESVSLDEIDQLNHFERDATLYAREIRDIGYSDAPEALTKLDGLVAMCSEHRARIIRRADEEADGRAREEQEVSTPPAQVSIGRI